MARERVFSGEMQARVEVFEYTKTTNESGEAVKTEISLGKKWAKRERIPGTEVEDGRLIPLEVTKYYMRFSPKMITDGTKYFIRDFDGDWDVNSVTPFGSIRNSFIEIKCSKRG